MHFPKSKIHKELGHGPDAGYSKMAKVELRKQPLRKKSAKLALRGEGKLLASRLTGKTETSGNRSFRRAKCPFRQTTRHAQKPNRSPFPKQMI